MHDDLAKQIAANRKEARRIERELCALHRKAVAAAKDAGHISEATAALVSEPKD